MREILFRAKRTDSEEWVEGFYQFIDWIYPSTGELAERKYYIRQIRSQDAFEVNPDTICQYTGMTDKNGNKIWENDIIKVRANNRAFISQIEWDDYSKGFTFQDSKSTWCGMDAFATGGCYRFGCEVIGNIFDNADLLKE